MHSRALLPLFLAILGNAGAADFPGLAEGDWVVRDFRFHSGEVLPEMRLHYTTLGSTSGQPVMILHGTGGAGRNFLTEQFAGQLFGPGEPLDASRFFIILPDAIGSGKSSKPSDGLRTRFPRYTYADIVRGQYRLVTEHLGLKHLKAIIGISAGGMQTWLWSETYPEFMDAVVPLAAEPAAMGGRNWMTRRMVIDAIRNDPEWKGGNYDTQPAAFRIARVFFGIATAGGALAIYTAYPTAEKADRELDRRLAHLGDADANDTLYALEASHDYDPSTDIGKIRAKVLAINSADDERNPPELGVMEAAMKHIPDARYVLIPVGPETRGHGTTGNAGLWKSYLEPLLARR